MRSQRGYLNVVGDSVGLSNTDHDGVRIPSLTVPSGDLSCQLMVVFGRFAFNQSDGAVVALDFDMWELAKVPAKIVTLALIPTDDYLEVRSGTEVPTDLEKDDVIQGIVTPTP